MGKRWKVLSSRLTAKGIFELAKKENFNIIFDFSWIELVNSSFTDELFWKMIEQNIQWFKIINIEKELIKKIIIYTMEERRKRIPQPA